MNMILNTDEIKCPCCGGAVEVDVFEWESDTGLPTEGGFHAMCANSQLEDAEWCSPNYQEGIELSDKVYRYLMDNQMTVRP